MNEMMAVAENRYASEEPGGYVIPFADPITAQLDLQVRTWDDLMRQRVRFGNRAVHPETGEVRDSIALELAQEVIPSAERKVHRRIAQLIREHPMADWLEEARTQGARVGTVLTVIKHPHRFPGQRCDYVDPKKGEPSPHYTLPVFEEGELCPAADTPEKGSEPVPCTGRMQAPRRGTGCRALWKMCGMYPVSDGKGGERLATYRKGVQGSHNNKAKTAILMPQGIAAQFYMQGSRYAEVYYEAKERLRTEHPDRRLGWSEATARVIAAKAWLGDLLMEWKDRQPIC